MLIKACHEYQLIQQYYGRKRAERSQVLLIQHIDEGLLILESLKASLVTMKAYCLHPILQADADLAENFKQISLSQIDPKALVLAMEYRNIANKYLSIRKIRSIYEIDLSPLCEVNQMLIADKIQNRKDFEIFHKDGHPRSEELDQYFKNWLRRLNISEDEYQTYSRLLEKRARY